MAKSQENYNQLLDEKKSKLQRRSEEHYRVYKNYKTQSENEINTKISNYVAKLTKKQNEKESK